MKKFTARKIEENQEHIFDIYSQEFEMALKHAFANTIQIHFEFDIDVGMGYDPLDKNLIMLDLTIADTEEKFGENQSINMLSDLSNINKFSKDYFKNFLILDSMRLGSNVGGKNIVFVYHFDIKKFYDDNQVKSLQGFDKYNL